MLEVRAVESGMRDVVRALSFAAAWALLHAAAPAHAQPRPDGLYAGRARTQRPMRPPRTRALASIDNDNRTYRFNVVYRMPRCPREVTLILGGTPGPAASSSIGNGECGYDFVVDRASADRIATMFAIPRLDRAPVGERVTGRFTTVRSAYAPGTPIEIRVTLANPSDAPAVQREVGCQRFAIVVYRDGQRITELHAGASGCPVGFIPLAAGASGEDVVDVQRWANIVTPGHYRFECRYDTPFAAAGVEIFTQPLGASARVWDRTFTGIVELDVR